MESFQAKEQIKMDFELANSKQLNEPENNVIDSNKKKRKRSSTFNDDYFKYQVKKKKVPEIEESKISERVKSPAIQEMVQKMSDVQVLLQMEKNLKDLVSNHKEFYNNFKKESYYADVQQFAKKKMFGNKDQFHLEKNKKQWNDGRLTKMNPDWFRDAKILDIGCNTGLVDLEILARFNPRLVIGVDIDHKAIKKAITNMQVVINNQQQLELFYSQLVKKKEKESESDIEMEFEADLENKIKQREKKLKQLLERVQKLPKSLQISIQGELSAVQHDPMLFVKMLREKGKISGQKELKNYMYGKISFRTENYLQNVSLLKEKFNTILCLSTTKWIHLNYGDIGIKTLFLKAYEQLEPQGYFILEAQLWKSYKKSKNMAQIFKENIQKIQLRPSLFKDYLEQIGLKHIGTMFIKEAEDLKNEKTRPIMVFQK